MARTVRRGDHGVFVRRLQSSLNGHGFPCGRVDGRFGPATEAALLAFQLSEGLLVDGICGPLTWQALEPAGGEPLEGEPFKSRRPLVVDLEIASAMLPFTRLDSIAAHLPIVLAALARFGLGDKPMVLMALATVRAESESFEPVAEEPSRFNTSPAGHAFDLYDYRRDLGNEGPPDGMRYRGRGFVQLTGRDNYRRTGTALGLDDLLVRHPERACEPALAADILAVFLKMRSRPIKEALIEGDLARARRLVNGGRHGLERFAEAYRTGDRLLADEVWGALPAWSAAA